MLGNVSAVFGVLGRFKHIQRLLGGILFRLFAAAACSHKFSAVRQFNPYFKNLCMLWAIAAQPGVQGCLAKLLLRGLLQLVL